MILTSIWPDVNTTVWSEVATARACACFWPRLPSMRTIACTAIALAVVTSAPAAEIGALLDQAKAASARKEHAKTVAALEEALAEARREAPLTASPFVLVTGKAPSFGAYTARRDAVFSAAEEIHFYFEPKNLVYPKTSDGSYAPGLTVDMELLGPDGEVLGKKDAFGNFAFASKSRLQDIFVNLTLTLTGAPPGKYTVRYTVRDKNSPKTALLTQVLTLK